MTDLTSRQAKTRWPSNDLVRMAGAVVVGSVTLAAVFLLNMLHGELPPAPTQAFPAGRTEGPQVPPPSAPLGTMNLDAAGVRLPPSVPAASAGLPDGEEVVGVSVGGRYRAYRLAAMAQSPALHVLNDRIADRPISVTYCDLRDCVAVFTGAGDEPLELREGGLFGGRMVLRVDGHGYLQETLEPPTPGDAPPFPYAVHPWERTTWGAWSRAHPATDVYTGDHASDGR